MAPLPIARLKPAPAWHYISLEYFGPFDTKGEVNKRDRGKGNGVIVNCMQTRAVHLELCPDYSTDKFLLGFRSFVATRGYPKEVYSDGGSQLTAAYKELKMVLKDLSWSKIQEFGATEGLEWHFTPGESPWKNECSEALVKSAKKCIKHAVGQHVLTNSELSTVFIECANSVRDL